MTKFKATHNTSKLLIKKSKLTGKLYATTEDNEFVGMLLPDFDKTKPVFIITFTDSKSGESWQAVGNESTASAPEYTL